MNTQTLARRFQEIGAELETTIWSPGPRGGRMREEYTLDIGDRKGREVFALVLRPDAVDTLEMLAIDVQPKDRHLLLLAKPISNSGEKRKFLCGHDERHWFVAGIPKAVSVTDVAGAMEALKPAAARLSQRQAGVRSRNWNRRRNEGFVRQGEWFFLPQPDLSPNEKLILRDEPIRRSGGKPHMVEELYRIGGTKVYVTRRFPRGITEQEYRNLIARRPEAVDWPWEVMQRNPLVYARGKIRHSDHATIRLPFWHRVVMSDEQSMPNVVFLD